MNKELVYKTWDKVDVDYFIHKAAKMSIIAMSEMMVKLPIISSTTDETNTIEGAMILGNTLKEMFIEDFSKIWDESMKEAKPILKKSMEAAGQ